MTLSDDRSHGYDALAQDFLAARSSVGASLVRDWAQSLTPNSTVIDIGAGSGHPLTVELVTAGHHVWALDASPKLVAAFTANFPDIPIACEPAEQSAFFDRTFDAALMVGLLFLLPRDRQLILLDRIASALIPGGRLLFSAPKQVCEWTDVLTGRPSASLGEDAYREHLAGAGCVQIDTHLDAGDNHYFDVRKG